MKKIAFVLVAMFAIVLTGCKTERSKVTVTVEDALGLPVAQRYVFYADYATLITDAIAPSPEELATGVSDVWEVATTNAAGFVTLDISLSVSKLKYCFMVYDMGTKDWKEKTVELRRGVNEEINFVVNQ